MKQTTRWLPMLLCLAALLGLVTGCGGKEGPPASSDTQPAVTQGDNWNITLPDRDLELKTFRILGRDGGGNTMFTNFEFDADADGTLMNDAVFSRNESLETRYNFVVEYSSSDNVNEDVQVLYGAEEDAYDLVIYQVSKVQPHASTGYLTDLYSLPWLDFGAPCWNETANAQLSMLNRLYFTTSDYLLLDKNRTYLNIYNRELARDHGLGYLEDIVKDGSWTYERFLEVEELLTLELDGVDGHSANDGFGLVMDSYNAFVPFVYGGGLRLSSKTDDDLLELTGNDGRATDIIAEALRITCDENMAMFCNDYNNNWAIANDTFYARRALITTTFLSVFDTSMGEKCDFEYGFLPFPKLEQSQDAYYTVPDTQHSQVFAVPVFVQDKDFAGYVLELFSEASTNTTLEVFYEQKCKLQNSYDQLCADMLDLIFANVVYDAVLVGDFGGLCSLLNVELPSKKLNIYSGMYRSRSATAEAELEKLIAAYQSR